ncbi:hypothetical protein [Sphingobium sp.]|uniref:hypothetical protein n=1 Tax=Sphingobium sp. TaxID=1912891 RepID=UPI002C6C175A|nr:hypothetical protein [Sphingobium sp.]HUD95851.1 hypothetical protein [Sphingobium sp.]
MDVALLAIGSRQLRPWGPTAFVLGVTVADVAVARALDRITGKMLPVIGHEGDPPGSDTALIQMSSTADRPGPTTVEPAGVTLHQAPAVPTRRRF